MIASARLEEIHKSDPSCLARLFEERTTRSPSGPSAALGNLAHYFADRFLRESAEHPQVDPKSVVREVIATHINDPEVDEDVVEKFILLMSKALAPDSGIRFGLPPEPFEAIPEWRWGLSAELVPVSPCGKCGGAAYVPPWRAMPATPLCESCVAHPGWSAPTAFVGTIDRLEFNRKAGIVRAMDFKSILEMLSGEDVATDREALIYSLALLLHFPGVKEVTFEKIMLRHGYPARWVFRRGEPWEQATRGRLLAQRAKRLAAIESNRWPESLGTSCGWCSRINRCSEQHRARTSGSIPNATPTDRANDLLGVREWVKATDADLRRHVAVTGEPIPLDDGDGTVLGKKPAKDWVLADGQTYETILDGLATIQRGRGATEDEVAAFQVKHFRYVTSAYFPSRAKKALEEVMGSRQAGLLIEAGGWFERENSEEWSTWVPPDREERREMTSAELDARLDELLGG